MRPGINTDELLSNIINDLRVELADEFDRNFERKGFFDTPWAAPKRNISRGSLMVRSGDLRRSIISRVSGHKITFTSSLPYASIHNEGGELTVTAAMKRFFWAKHLEAAGSIETRKSGAPRATQRNIALSAEALYYKGLALMKIGSKLIIPKRQFIGHHPQVDKVIRQIVDENVQGLADDIAQQLRAVIK